MEYDEAIFEDTWKIYQTCTKESVITNPGSRKFLQILKQFGPINPVRQERGKYFQIVGYNIPRDIFLRAYMVFQNQIQQKRNEWTKLNDLEKLIAILSECFYRNRNAHNCHKRWAKWRSFDKKSDLLYKAIHYAGMLTNQIEGLSWGKQYDEGTPNHPIILYFQLGPIEDQVSFHCNIEDVRDFPGKWIGHQQDQCPKFDKIRKINKGISIPATLIKDFPKSLTEEEVNQRIEENYVDDGDFSNAEIEEAVQEEIKRQAQNPIISQPEKSKPKTPVIMQKLIDDFLPTK